MHAFCYIMVYIKNDKKKYNENPTLNFDWRDCFLWKKYTKLGRN
jgi:hypothetical protein